MDKYLDNELTSSGVSAQYDEHAKRLLKDKNVLAFIMVHCVREFDGYSLENAKEAIEGEPEVSKRPVRPTAAIYGDNTDGALPGEGIVTFDIVFHAVTRDGIKTKLYINVEAQKSFYPGYDLTTRGIIYPVRLLSQQMDVEYTAENYDGVKKVYSIWICFNAPGINRENRIVADSITKFEIKPTIMHDGGDGAREVLEGRYDLLCTIFIRLGSKTLESENKLIGMLSTLFSNKLNTEERKERLKSKYGFDLSSESEKEVNVMCNLSGIISEEAVRKRDREMIARMLKEKRSPEEIHDFCKYPMELILDVLKELGEEDVA